MVIRRIYEKIRTRNWNGGKLMRYYSVILININRGVIEICDIRTPYTKQETQQWAKIQASTKKCFILCVIETKEIGDRLALAKFNLKNLKKGCVL